MVDGTPMTEALPPAKKPLSEAQLAQRRAASVHAGAAATGPRTEEGKAIASRNAWKHGLRSDAWQRMQRAGQLPSRMMFGKPCVTTCMHHPENPNRTTHPCSHVVKEETRAGGDCLDRSVWADAFERIVEALEGGKVDSMHGLLAHQVADAIETLAQMKREILDNGLVISVPAIDRDGNVITRADGSEVIGKMFPNPAVVTYTRLLEVLGINLPELLATPRAHAREKVEGETGDAIQGLLGGIFARTGKRPAAPALPRPDDGE